MKIATSITAKILVFIILLFSCTLNAQLYEEKEPDTEDFEITRKGAKSAKAAILLSTIFPGSGHFYTNKTAIGTFIFPVVEIALWTGLLYFRNQGDQIEKDYQKYADKNYDRDRQDEVQDNLIALSKAGTISAIYGDSFFRLDKDNTQHFYEDIGKYNKYIFGWEDWYNNYVASDTGNISWEFDDNKLWVGNYPIGSNQESYDIPYSDMRAKYIRMRRDAQAKYDNSYLMGIGLAANRIISAVDSARETAVYNRRLRYTSNFDFQLQPAFVNNQLTPTFSLTLRY